MPWYVEAKAAQGSYATFLGLELKPPIAGPANWQAIAVGDCCLAEFRCGLFRGCFPLEHPQAFGSHPYALPSRAPDSEGIRGSVRRRTGTYGPGDAFALMTDAVAQWFLAHVAAHPQEVSRVIRLLREDISALRDCLIDAREQGRLRNDDVTVLFVECPPASKTASLPLP